MTDMQRYDYDHIFANPLKYERDEFVLASDAEAAIAAAEQRGFKEASGLCDGATTGYWRGQRDMLAKCIAAVEALPVGISDDRFMPDDPPKYLRYYNEESVLTALRALQEKP